VKPVGATERRRIDVRIIAATNRDLDSAIKTGAFRQGLYFRLNVVQRSNCPFARTEERHTAAGDLIPREILFIAADLARHLGGRNAPD